MASPPPRPGVPLRPSSSRGRAPAPPPSPHCPNRGANLADLGMKDGLARPHPTGWEHPETGDNRIAISRRLQSLPTGFLLCRRVMHQEVSLAILVDNRMARNTSTWIVWLFPASCRSSAPLATLQAFHSFSFSMGSPAPQVVVSVIVHLLFAIILNPESARLARGGGVPCKSHQSRQLNTTSGLGVLLARLLQHQHPIRSEAAAVPRTPRSQVHSHPGSRRRTLS